ncbi:hypothetical protein JCM14244_13900 [Venenivibrio stagnispumantis]|uniref:histidine kinase n=1 Tax=Venenivibrio stagnispumantis TaxID=407998 RepID=A0AA45WKM2_9AQUI|nr:ATP-binding protein [Venenivibrio stagnispumantis]MCW4573169.1 ATP-binding protein [Venenivibrio stagnispumantis]SMP08205.1 two-component system, NtrC family, nitrogen regulation sensor histidine kinase GlnL [Venenivibrio stagnispumantis]
MEKDILESITQPVFIVNLEKEIIYQNQSAKSYFDKKSLHQFIEKIFSLRHIKDGFSIINYFLEISELKFIVDIYPYKEEYIIIFAKDITRYFELEEISRKEDIIFALSKMIAEIFHDMKGPISGIKAAAQFLKENPEELSLIDDIIEETDRLTKMINEITFINKDINLKKEPTNIHKLIDKVIKSFQKEYKEVIFERLYDPSIPDINIDKDYLTRVFINLIRNSIEAINGKGKIQIQTGISFDKILSPKGNKIYIRIKDSGKGIPKELEDKIFLPFITTKSSGMGIGLASAYKIIKKHEGIIRYIKDATFEILLPIK